MSSTKYLCILLLITAVSCEKDDHVNNFPAEVKFDVSGHLLEGRGITCIDFDDEGNPLIGSGTFLYQIKGGSLKDYNLGYPVLDLTVAPDQSIWIGTGGGGLCHFKDGQTTWYTMENAGLPRDYVMNVEAAPDGRIWFASCAHRLGGLGIYDGRNFTFLTPENSPLNQNMIDDIEINEDGIVFISTSGTVGRTNIYSIDGNDWKCLGSEEGTFYWIFNFSVSPSGIIYLVEDFSLSSTFRTNRLFSYSNNNWGNIVLEEGRQIGYFSITGTDRRDYCWVPSANQDGLVMMVYTGKKWEISPTDFMPGDIITVIEADNENNIWLGTYTDGIYILNQ